METVYFGTAGAQRFLHLIQSGKRLKPVRQTRSQRSVK